MSNSHLIYQIIINSSLEIEANLENNVYMSLECIFSIGHESLCLLMTYTIMKLQTKNVMRVFNILTYRLNSPGPYIPQMAGIYC